MLGDSLRFQLRPVFGLLAFGALCLLSFQNCGFQGAGDTGAGSVLNNSPGNSSGLQPPDSVTQLQCTNAPSYVSTNRITAAQEIASIGRLSFDESVMGFITPTGRLFVGPPDGSVVEPDPGYVYKWGSFEEAGSCGITTAGIVRCAPAHPATAWTEVSALNGSTQIAAVTSTKLCGLQSDGSVKCIDSGNNPIALTLPEPMRLITDYEFYGVSGAMYFVSDLLQGTMTPDSTFAPTFLLSTQMPYYTDTLTYVTNICGLTIAQTAFPEPANYVTPDGCVLSESGTLFCMSSHYDGNSQSTMSAVDGNGNYTRELVPIDPAHQYTAVSYANMHTACAIRSDQQVVCFTLGYDNPFPKFEADFSITPSTKIGVQLANPANIVGGMAEGFKGCAVYANGQANCWQYPSYDKISGTHNVPYAITSDPLASLVGILEPWDSTVGYFGTACFLTTTGHLECEAADYASSANGHLTLADSTTYKSLHFDSWGSGCGLTTSGTLRCTADNTGNVPSGPPALSDVLANVVFYSTDSNDSYYLTSTGHYGIVETVTLTDRGTTSVVYHADVPGHPGLFSDASNNIYYMSRNGPVQMSPSDYSSIQSIKAFWNETYFDSAHSRCPYILGDDGLTLAWSCYLGTESLSNVPTFNYFNNYTFVKTDGTVHGEDQGQTDVDFFPPTVVTPVH